MDSNKDLFPNYSDYYDDWIKNKLEYTYKSLRASQETTNIILTAFLATVFLFGSTGNILVLIVFARNKTKQTATVFIMALATTDLTICLVVLPGVLIKEWFVPFRWDALCRGWELVRCATIPLSSLILAIVAVDRYIMICRVGRCKSISTQQAKWILIGIIMCSLGLGIPPMLRVGVYQLGQSGNSTEYLGLCVSNDFLIGKATVDHYWQAMAAKFFLVLVVVVVLYSMIFKTIYQQGMWRPGAPQSFLNGKKSSAKGAHENSNRAREDTAEVMGPGLQNVTADITSQHMPAEQTNSIHVSKEHLPDISCLTSQIAVDRLCRPPSKLKQQCSVIINVSEVVSSVLDVDTNKPVEENHGHSLAHSLSPRGFKTNQQTLADVERVDTLQNTALDFQIVNNSRSYQMTFNQHKDSIGISCIQIPTDALLDSKLLCSPIPVDSLHEGKLLCDQIPSDGLQESKLLSHQIPSDGLLDSKLLSTPIPTDGLKEGKLLCDQIPADNLLDSKLLCSPFPADCLQEGTLLCDPILTDGLQESKLLCSPIPADGLQESKLLCDPIPADGLKGGKLVCDQIPADGLKEGKLYDKLNHAINPHCFNNEQKDEADKHARTIIHTNNNLDGLQTSHVSEVPLNVKGERNQDDIFILKTKAVRQDSKHECLTNFHAGLTRPSGHSNFFNLKFFCRNKVYPVRMHDSVTMPALSSDSDHTQNLANPEPQLQYHISDARQRRMWSAQVKTAKVLLLVTVVYVLSFAPVLLMTLDAIPSHPIPFYGYFLHSAANPIIYSFININFRKQLMQLFKCRQFTE